MAKAHIYLTIIEPAADGSYGAYVPDLPGCVACGEALEEVQGSIGEAIRHHIDSLQHHGEPVPKPSSIAYSAGP